MRKLLLAYLSLIPLASFAQIREDITLEWLEKKEISFGNYTNNVPQFSGNNYFYDISKKMIFYNLEIKEVVSFNKNDLQITNITYEPLTVSQLGELTLENIPKNPNASLKITNSRDLKQAFLWLSPIIKDDFGYKRIKSFSYSIKNSSARISQSSKRSNFISNSVLASGDWYRFYIEKSGVYKISKSFLQQLGLNTNNIDPRKIKIYGNGGKMLPLSNSDFYPLDLTENAIQIIGESDGVFNNDDFILFYAEGVDTWNNESQTFNNLYSEKSYYYISTQGDDGKRIPKMTEPSGNSSLTLNTFDDHQYHELDLTNISRLGRQWFGESFDINQEQEFKFNFPNLDPTTPVKIMATAASAAFTPTSFKVAANGQDVGTITFPALSCLFRH